MTLDDLRVFNARHIGLLSIEHAPSGQAASTNNTHSLGRAGGFLVMIFYMDRNIFLSHCEILIAMARADDANCDRAEEEPGDAGGAKKEDLVDLATVAREPPKTVKALLAIGYSAATDSSRVASGPDSSLTFAAAGLAARLSGSRQRSSNRRGRFLNARHHRMRFRTTPPTAEPSSQCRTKRDQHPDDDHLVPELRAM
jgi:hypothetical protein